MKKKEKKKKKMMVMRKVKENETKWHPLVPKVNKMK